MKLFALVVNGLVENVSVADADWSGENWIKVKDETNCGIGYAYNADADAFIAPRPKCGHKELFLNDFFKWNCQRCELDAKSLFNEA